MVKLENLFLLRKIELNLLRIFLSINLFIVSIVLTLSPSAKASEISEVKTEKLVSQLSDVRVADWAFSSLQSLRERYGCLTGYPDSTYKGNRSLTRYEFAVGLNACLDAIAIQLQNQTIEITAADLTTIRRLQNDFAKELKSSSDRIGNIAAKTDVLESQQFSTTAKLSIASVFAVSDLRGDTADGNSNTEIDSNPVFNHRTRLNFTSSFTGEDRLMVRLQASDRVPNFDGAADTNMTRLSFEVGNTDNSIRLNLLEYQFPLAENLQIYLYGNAASHHYYANVINPNFASFGGGKGTVSRFLDRNPIYRLGFISPAGVAAVYDNRPIRIDVGYLAENSESASQGLFGDIYSALGQVSFQPSDNFELGFTYIHHYSPDGNLLHRTGSSLANIPFGDDIPLITNAYGVQANWNILPKIAVSGWWGYIDTKRVDGVEGNADIINYAINLAFLDLFKEGAIAGLGVGMPPKVVDNTVANREDPDTSLHFEVFYQYPLSDSIKLIPGAVYVTNADHNNANGDIVVGTFRTVFSF